MTSLDQMHKIGIIDFPTNPSVLSFLLFLKRDYDHLEESRIEINIKYEVIKGTDCYERLRSILNQITGALGKGRFETQRY